MAGTTKRKHPTRYQKEVARAARKRKLGRRRDGMQELLKVHMKWTGNASFGPSAPSLGDVANRISHPNMLAPASPADADVSRFGRS